MAKPAFTEHPDFVTVSAKVNAALMNVATEMGCGEALTSFALEANANRVADDMAKLILRAMNLSAEAA